MIGPEKILGRFDELLVEYEIYHHEPIDKVSDRDRLGLTYGGAAVCKNLLLTVRNNNVYILLMILARKTADLKAVAKQCGTSRLCFASDLDLARLLGQEPGCVGVTGVINDTEHKVHVVFDSGLLGKERVAMHPGDNSMSIVMPFEGLEKYIKSCGASYSFIDI